MASASGPPGFNQVRDRRTGALAAPAEAGTRGAGGAAHGTAHRNGGPGRGGPAAGALRPSDRRVLRQRPARPGRAAVPVRHQGLRSGDLTLVGYDDIEFTAAAAVPLTSARQPAATMGAPAAGLLLEETGAGAAEVPHEHRRWCAAGAGDAALPSRPALRPGASVRGRRGAHPAGVAGG
ncbi:substrate-binding domain-containing protein [Streptomyces sp. SM11]|uniref:substrate-binding domain-containing protein n=1 Tax=Streptomyces sp. SM11 TaxID=565557 RepID=UPI0035BBA647